MASPSRIDPLRLPLLRSPASYCGVSSRDANNVPGLCNKFSSQTIDT